MPEEINVRYAEAVLEATSLHSKGVTKTATNWTRTVALLSAVALVVHLSLRMSAGAPSWIVQAPLYVALTLGGIPLLVTLLRKLLSGEFGSDFLAGLSI